MASALQAAALNQLFRTARTYNEWSETTVGEGVIRDLYDLLKWGPTSANCCPARFVWIRSQEGKSQLASFAMETNRSKILAAPLSISIFCVNYFNNFRQYRERFERVVAGRLGNNSLFRRIPEMVLRNARATHRTKSNFSSFRQQRYS